MDRESHARPHTTFIVPCYNESENIAGAIGEIEHATREAALPSYEIVVVDDCSKDGSAEIVARLSAANPALRLIRNPRNLGFGGAYKEGLKHAKGAYAIMVPGDNAHPSRGIAPILGKAGSADIVVPYMSNSEVRPLLRRVVSRSFVVVMNLLFGLRLPYYTGLVLHKTDLLRSIAIETDSFAYQAEALVKLVRGGATYTTLAVEIVEHPEHRTSAFRLKNIYRVFKAIARLWIEVRFRSAPAAKVKEAPRRQEGV